MGDWQLLFPSKYLSAPDLAGTQPTLEIANVRRVEIDGTEEVNGDTVEVKLMKGIVTFKGIAKDYVLTKAFGFAMEAMFGSETKQWIGKLVTLYTPPEKWFGEMKPRIRVRGSPSLKAPMTVTKKLGRKKYKIELLPTVSKAAAKPPEQQETTEKEPGEGG